MRYGIVADRVFTSHRPAAPHPERPERIEAILSGLEKCTLPGPWVRVSPRRAEEEWILRVHAQQHLERIRETAGAGNVLLDPDTYTCSESFETALLAAGSTVELCKKILSRELDAGCALVRPPGHHAESSRAMGFCLFNNVAVAAQWALDQFGLERVAVVDFDVHHGNGTQQIFYSRADVLYISSHQYPFYPGTGHFSETGSGRGRGLTVNFPLSAGVGNGFYHSLYEQLVAPVLMSFRPQMIFVSAGFDAHGSDPLAGMALTEDGFVDLTNILNGVAGQVCEGRILYVLEGGYDLKALAASVVAMISTTLSPRQVDISPASPTQFSRYRELLQEAVLERWEL